jgi:hypothetical protein
VNLATLDAVRRPLTDNQRRLIRAKARSLTNTGRRASAISLPITAGVTSLLWLWTILASDASRLVVTVFWVVIGAGITLWVRRDMRTHARQLQGMAQGLESALRRNEADAYDIRGSAHAVFEEIEDEGACYAFELEGGRLVFVAGQEFYESPRFPSLDFSLVYPLDEQGQPVEMFHREARRLDCAGQNDSGRGQEELERARSPRSVHRPHRQSRSVTPLESLREDAALGAIPAFNAGGAAAGRKNPPYGLSRYG